MRRILIAVAVALALLIAYLQTADGFRRVLLPALAATLGAESTAQSGRLRLDGTLLIEGLAFRDPEGSVVLTAERVEGSVGLASLLSGRPRILDLSARNAVLRIRPQPADAAEDSETGPRSVHELLRIHIPVDLDRATLQDFSLHLLSGEAPRASLGPLQVRIEHLAPAASGRAEIAGPVTLAPGDPQDEYRGDLEGALRVELTEEADLRRWTVDGNVSLRRGDAEPFAFNLDSTATIGRRVATGSARVAGRRGAEDLGTVEAGFDLPAPAKAGAGGEPNGPSVDIALRAVSSRFLDPFVTALGDTHLASGQVDGSVRVQPTAGGDAVDVRADLDARDLRLMQAGQMAAPLRIQLNHEATWRTASQRLELRAATGSLALGEATVMSLDLLSPTAISFAEPAAGMAVPNAPHSIRTRIEGLPIDALADWLALAGVALPPQIAHAILDGELAFGVPQAGTPILGDARIDVHQLVLDESGAAYSAEASAHTAIVPLRGMRIEEAKLQLDRRREPLAVAQLSGALAWSPANLALTVGLDVPDAVSALRDADVGEPDTLRGGRLRIEGTVSQPPEGIQLDARVKLADVNVRGSTRGLERDLSAAATLRADGDVLFVDVRDLRTTPVGTPTGAVPGQESCSAQGQVPLTGQGSGRIDVRCAAVPLAPWIELAVPGWAAMGPTPMDAAVIVQFDPQSTVRIDGQQTIQVRDLDGRPIAIALTNAVRRRDKVIEFDVRLLSSRPTPDRAAFAGSLQELTRPQLRLTATIDNADLTPLAPVFEAQREAIERFGVEVARVVQRRALRPADFPRLPLDVDAEVNVAQVRYRAIEAGPGRSTAKLLNTRWDVDVAPTRLNGGQFSGHFDRTIETFDEAIGWTARIQNVELGDLVASLRGGGPSQVDGVLSLEADLRGRSPADANLIEALNGRLGLTVNDARLRGIEPLKFLATRTGVKQLDRIPLDTFDVIANAEVERGVARSDRSVVASPAAHFEIGGRVMPDGQLDLTILPLVGPGLARELVGFGILQRVVGTVEGLAALPILIRVRGPMDNPRYSAEPTTPKALSTTNDIVQGTARQVGGIVDSVRGLLGGKR